MGLKSFEGITRLIDENRLIKLLSDMVSLRSDTADDMEYGIAVYLKEVLEEIGAEVELQHVELKRYNVIARFRGTGQGKTFMYCGHIDVVPPGNEENWRTPPFTAHIEDGLIYGRGTSDMKGSIASIIHTMEILKKLNFQLKGDVLLVLDADEEISNKGLYKFFKSDIKADACLIGEPTKMEVCLGHKGVLGFWLKFKGKKVHASQPQLGINPITHAMKFSEKLDKFSREVLDKRVSSMGRSTMTITYINAGKELNSVPPECDVRVDRRLIMGETKESCIKELEEILCELRNEIKDFNCDYQITTYCGPGEIGPDNDLVKDVQFSINPENPEIVPLAYLKATCEASLVADNMNIPVVICGPGNMEQAHVQNEFIEISQLGLASEVYARLILKYFNENDDL